MSLRLTLINPFLRRCVRPFVGRSGRPEDVRRHLALATRIFLHGPRVPARDGVLNGVPVVEFLPEGADEDRAIVYFHGGAYVAGSPMTHRAMLSVLARKTGFRVIAPHYRLAPEHPFPAAFEDATRVLSARDPSLTVLGGDSAGGGLALAALAAELGKGRRVAGFFAFSPWTDLAATGASLVENAARDVLLPAKRLPQLVDMVLAGADPRDPRISPHYARFPDPPPFHLTVAESEILRDDALRLAGRLEGQGASVTLDTLAHAPHVWPMLVGLLPEAEVSLDRTASFIRTCLTPPIPRSGN